MNSSDPRWLARPVALLVAAAGWIAASGFAGATERRFVYSYGAHRFIPDGMEIETWMTWNADGGSADRYDIRNEFEWALTERFQVGLYLPSWRLTEGDGAEFRSVDIETIYNFTDPAESWLGTSVYGEMKFGNGFFKLEGKGLLQKDFGPLTLVYNAVAEAEWEGARYTKSEGELKHSIGLSYMISPRIALGLEAYQKVDLPGWDWSEKEKASAYLGPNASFRLGKTWLTLAGLWEWTDTSAANFQLRAIWGIHF